MSQPTLRQLLDAAQHAISAGRMNDCASLLRQAIVLSPQEARIYNALGVALQKTGQLNEAIQSYRTAVELDLQLTEAQFNLTIALRDAGQIEPAIESLQKALTLQPNHAGAWNNLGTMLWGISRREESLQAYQRAAILKPDAADVQNNLGTAQLHLGQFHEAKASLERAVTLQPDLAVAHYTLALVLLLTGDFQNGWREYEWRFRVPQLEKLFDHFPQPMWDGQDLVGKRLLVHDEQGLGDVIQFARYLSMLQQRGAAEVYFLCEPQLVKLMENLNPPARLIPRGQAMPAFDVQCPLMSLPRLFETTLQSIPASVPYLHADPKLVGHWRERIGSETGALKVGLVWAGRASYVNDQTRSIALSAFSSLCGVTGIQLFSLQKNPGHSLSEFPMTDWTDELHDFADTAALIENLDLVITVDTAVAHLAGVMGKPVWILLPYVPDWRWMLDRTDSPWYPTARLFRQKKFGDWQTPIRDIVEALQCFKITSA